MLDHVVHARQVVGGDQLRGGLFLGLVLYVSHGAQRKGAGRGPRPRLWSCHDVPVTGDEELDATVIVAGFGPVGAVVAALLGSQGVRTLVVEPNETPYP